MDDFTTDDDQSTSSSGSNSSKKPSTPSGLTPTPATVGMGSSGAAAMLNKLTAEAMEEKLGLINYNARFATATPAAYRDEVIAQTLAVLLGQKKPNPLLVGAPGVGKTRVVEEIARMIATGNPLIPPRLSTTTIFELALSTLVSGSMFQGAIEAKLENVLNLACDPEHDIVLFIDEIHLLNSRDPSYSKIGELLKPALARGDLRVIGATTSQERKALSRDAALSRRFTPVIVDELTPAQTRETLTMALDGLLEHYDHQITVPETTLDAVVALADANSASLHRPDNALTLLDRSMAAQIVKHLRRLETLRTTADPAVYAAAQVTPELTAQFVEHTALRMLSGTAVRPTSSRTALLEALEPIRGQEAIKDTMVDLIQRRSLNLMPSRRPLSLLFAGPSGTGKTETAKVIARTVTGQEPIIVNMTEYSSAHTQTQLLGSSPGFIGSESAGEKPFDTLESNPYRVILLDEMEKAHVEIQRTFLSALDEGRITDASGKVLDFSKSIIIMTTNAGRDEMTKRTMGFGTSESTQLTHAEVVKALERSFEPELLGRITTVVAFATLSRETYQQIVLDRYAALRAEVLTRQPRLATIIPETVDPEVLTQQVAQTYLPHQGARPAQALAQQLIETAVMAGRNIV